MIKPSVIITEMFVLCLKGQSIGNWRSIEKKEAHQCTKGRKEKNERDRESQDTTGSIYASVENQMIVFS